MEVKSIKQSCSESIIVSLLKRGPMHGYEMVREIQQRSGGYFSFGHSTLYPVLHKLEKKGLIKGVWQHGDNERPRKYYNLTKEGERYLNHDTSQWREFFRALTMILPEVSDEVSP